MNEDKTQNTKAKKKGKRIKLFYVTNLKKKISQKKINKSINQ